MRILDLLTSFDSALDWPLDDPFLAEHEPPADRRDPAWSPSSSD